MQSKVNQGCKAQKPEGFTAGEQKYADELFVTKSLRQPV